MEPNQPDEPNKSDNSTSETPSAGDHSEVDPQGVDGVMPRSNDVTSSRRASATLKDLHRALTKPTIRDRGRGSARDPVMGKGLFFGGLTTLGRHWLAVRNRGYALQTEAQPAIGQAAKWLKDVEQVAPLTGVHVARQLARLCGADSTVSIPDRSLSDAVGMIDSAGRQKAFTERGVQWLTENGWVVKEVEGYKKSARTTYYLTSP